MTCAYRKWHMLTPGPTGRYCVSCGLSLLEIDANKVRCRVHDPHVLVDALRAENERLKAAEQEANDEVVRLRAIAVTLKCKADAWDRLKEWARQRSGYATNPYDDMWDYMAELEAHDEA